MFKKINNKVKYDLIFSIGEFCSCSELIRTMNYQNYSYPFDWIAGCTFLERAKILSNDFKDFINKEDLEFLLSDPNTNNDVYKNKYNNLIFKHDFIKGVDFDDIYSQIKAKYDRRIKRLLENINNSQNILIIYLEAPIKNHIYIEDKDIIDGFNIIKKRYPNKNINLLYFTNTEEKRIVDLNENIRRFYLDYKKNKDFEDNIPRLKVLQKILKEYKFEITLLKKIQIFLLYFIPFKPLRKKYKKRFHVKC